MDPSASEQDQIRYGRLRKELLAYALQLGAATDDAECLVQDAFVVWLLRLSPDRHKHGLDIQIRDAERFLRGVVQKLKLAGYRRQARRAKLLNRVWYEYLADEVGAWREIEAALLVDQLMERLDRSDREVLKMRFLSDHSYTEIADRMRISENTARVRVHRALRRARQLVATRYVA